MNTLPEFAAIVGWDWADQKHDLWLRPSDGSKAQHLRLEQTPEALHEWVAKMRERFGGRAVAIAIEASRGPVISALLGYDFLVLFPLNPKAMKDYRGAFAVSGATNDRSAAQLHEEFVRLHRDKVRALQADTELTRRLAGLVENRRHLVDERTRMVNQLHSLLKTYYPLAENLLGKAMTQPLAAEFLLRWPDLDHLQKAKPEVVRAFYFKHNSRRPKTIQAHLEAIASAHALTTDTAIILPARQMVLALAGMLRPLHQAIGRLDQLIQEAMDQHPDAAIFRSFPGAGPAMSPRLLVAFGTNRERFASAQEVAQFYGLAPVVKQSGNTKTVQMRHRCPKFGRQSFHETAACARNQELWAGVYYDQKRDGDKRKHHETCRALAFKLVRIQFACWKNRTPYDSERYLASLKKHGSPLHTKLQNQG
jgi:transposase